MWRADGSPEKRGADKQMMELLPSSLPSAGSLSRQLLPQNTEKEMNGDEGMSLLHLIHSLVTTSVRLGTGNKGNWEGV